jgi:DNA ligase-1
MLYSSLVDLYSKLESTSKRLEKTIMLAGFLKESSSKEVDKLLLLVQGMVFSKHDPRKIGIASKLVVKALNFATGARTEDLELSWKKTGDLGMTAQEFLKKKRQNTLFSEDLTMEKVFNNLQKLAGIEGVGSTDLKLKIIAELLTSASPHEARYVVRTLLEDLRVGLGEGTIRDAISVAYYEQNIRQLLVEDIEGLFSKDSELTKMRDIVQEAYNITNDYSQVARILKEKDIAGLKELSIDPLKPLKVMLAQKVSNLEEGFDCVGMPAVLEFKYDGFRMLIGRGNDELIIHTRRLENVTRQFPEVAILVKDNVKSKSFIIDCEAVGFDPNTHKYVPFQNISQRIMRKYDIEQIAGALPVELNVFDILYYEGKSMIDTPFSERRKILEKIIHPKIYAIKLAEQITTDSEAEGEKFYRKSLAAGNEGIMLKSLDAPYKPGSRVGYMVKLKPVMETLDLVIVAAEWGEGKRAGWLTSFTVACYDSDSDEFLELGKFGTGIKEKEDEGTSFEGLTELLKPNIISEKGRTVIIRPNIIVEISFEEVQKSPSYSSGYALRFPRLVRVREDRGPDEASTLYQIEQMFKGQ